MPFDYAVPSVPDGSRIDYSDGLLVPLPQGPTTYGSARGKVSKGANLAVGWP